MEKRRGDARRGGRTTKGQSALPSAVAMDGSEDPPEHRQKSGSPDQVGTGADPPQHRQANGSSVYGAMTLSTVGARTCFTH